MSWINLQLKKQKYICNICYNPLNGVSVNRLDNNKAHIKNNCELTCVLCNVRAK